MQIIHAKKGRFSTFFSWVGKMGETSLDLLHDLLMLCSAAQTKKKPSLPEQ